MPLLFKYNFYFIEILIIIEQKKYLINPEEINNNMATNGHFLPWVLWFRLYFAQALQIKKLKDPRSQFLKIRKAHDFTRVFQFLKNKKKQKVGHFKESYFQKYPMDSNNSNFIWSILKAFV